MYSINIRKSIVIALFAILTVVGLGACGNDNNHKSKRSTVTSFELIPEPHVITKNPCGQGFSWCEKSHECIRPLALVKGGNVKEMEQIFKETCESRPDF